MSAAGTVPVAPIPWRPLLAYPQEDEALRLAGHLPDQDSTAARGMPDRVEGLQSAPPPTDRTDWRTATCRET